MRRFQFVMKKRVITVLLTFLSLICTHAQTALWHDNVNKFLSKKYILKKDLVQIDSLLFIIREKDGIDNNDYFQLGNIRVNKSSIGTDKYASVIPLVNDLKLLYTKGYGDEKQYESFLRKTCEIYSIAKVNSDILLSAYAELWELHKRNLSSPDSVDLKLLEQYCLRSSLAERYDITENLRLQSLQINKNIYGVNSSQYETALKKVFVNYNSWKLLGNVNEDVGKMIYRKSSIYIKEWLELKNIDQNIDDAEYKDIYQSYAKDLLYMDNDTLTAIKLLNNYSDKMREHFGDESEQYYDALNVQKDCYELKKQIPFLEKMLVIAEKVWGKNHLNYQLTSELLSTSQLTLGDIGAAISSMNDTDVDNYVGDLFSPLDSLGVIPIVDKSQMRVRILSSTALMNSMYGNWTIANKAYKEIIYNLIGKLDSPLSQLDFYSAYQGIINNYVTQNRKDSIVVFGKEIMPNIKYGEIVIELLASINYACRNEKSLKFAENILEENPSYKECSNYPIILECMAEIKGLNKDIDGAIQLVQEALSIRGDSLKNQIRKLVYEEIIYLMNEKYVEAFNINRKAENLIKKIPDYKKSKEYVSLLMRSCMEGVRVGEYRLVKDNGEYIRSQKNNIGTLHSFFDYNLYQFGSIFFGLQVPSQDPVIVPLIESYFNLSQLDPVETLLMEYVSGLHKTIISSLLLFGPSANNIIDVQQIGMISQNVVVKNAVRLKNDSISALAYNNALLTKQILLNANDNLKRLILSSDDDNIKKKYGELIQTQSLMDDAAYSGMSVDSLYQRKKALEIQLNTDSKLIGDYTKGLENNWKTIQNSLHPNEYAIEFTMYEDDGEEYYCAVILSSEQSPEIVYICSGSDIGKIKNPYSDISATNLIWSPLFSKLKNARKIFFSPVGKLHLIGIENFIMKDGSLISEYYNLYRVSSTNTLAKSSNGKAIKSGIIYGGLAYDVDLQTMMEENEKYSFDRSLAFPADYSIADSINLRSGVSYLPSTKVEAEEIGQILTKANIKNVVIQEKEGSESSFKSLSGQSEYFIHIATHGFYWSEKESISNSGLGFMMPFLRSYINKEDKAMVRSGLLFSGANNVLLGKSLPNDIDDGVLTAKEISSLDLRGVDLVVLSACQTGLGEIAGDGVWGLQRGFKKAGANTLMMSLWKVDDAVTQIFMTQFYTNLISGKSKFESLREAQRYIREYEIEKEVSKNSGKRPLSVQAKEQAKKVEKVIKKIRPYQNPKYWAAFILLDAIE